MMKIMWGFYQQKLVWKKEDSKACCSVEFRVNEVVGVTYLDVIVEGKNKIQIIKCLELIQNTLHESGIQSEYIMIVSYDAISEYYCSKIYPMLNKLERNLRKLLFNIYIVNFEKEYYRATISEELQNKANGVIRARGNSTQKEIIRLQEFFYSFEFNDIQKMLFTPSWTEYDIRAKDEFLSHNGDLSQLSDEELRTAFLKLTPKSDWERFFNDKITGVDFESLFESIRKYRNAIAHCKFFYNESYCECYYAIMQLNKAILGAIKETEKKEFAKKNSEALSKAFQRFQDDIKQQMESIKEAISKNLRFTYNVVPNSLYESIRATVSSALQSKDISRLAQNALQIQTHEMLRSSLFERDEREEGGVQAMGNDEHDSDKENSD